MIQLGVNFFYRVLKQLPLAHDVPLTGVKIDSRAVESGDLFVAVPGTQCDGHDYIAQAVERGAVAVLTSKPVPLVLAAHLSVIRVEDALAALGRVARAWRLQFNGLKTIGITGSCGKTSVKNMAAAILRASYDDASVYVSPGNYNSISGVPLSLLQLRPQHRFAVLELGMNRFGEIAATVAQVCPQVAAINHVAPAHTEHVGDLAGVAQAKGEILGGLQARGSAVLCADSPFLSQWLQQLQSEQNAVLFGLSERADVRLIRMDDGFAECRVTLNLRGEAVDVILPLPGRHNAMNAACAAACAVALGVAAEPIKQGLEGLQSIERRLQRLPGPNGSTVIDDTYNANPDSVKAAIDVLSRYPGRKILLLGDMYELGAEAERYHSEVGRYAKGQGIDVLLVVGDLSHAAVQAYGAGARHFTDRAAVVPVLLPLLDANTCVVVKGSNAMNMREFVEALRSAVI